MAQVNFYLPTNMTTIQKGSGTVTSATVSSITIVDGDDTSIYSGAFGFPPGDIVGVITGYTGFVGSLLSVSITGLSIDAHTAYVLAQASRQQDIFKLSLAGNDTIVGSSGSDVILAYFGDDQVRGSQGDDNIDGGAGFDAALYSNIASKYEVTVSGGSLTVRDRTGIDGIDTLSNIERVTFSDASIDATSFVKTGSLTKLQIDSLVEVYIATFNRAPDALGLNYWGGRFKDGMSLESIAESFFVQSETAAKYPAATTSESFIASVYGNVLGRAPDGLGLQYWMGELANGNVSRDKFLLAILNGAHANPGATVDVANLNNKVMVGEYFALAKGLNNGAWSQSVMAAVTSEASTVLAAKAMADSYAAAAEAPATTELVVKILGIVS